MASSSSTSTLSSLGPQVPEKLTRENYLLWRAQILPHFLGAGLYGYLSGSIPAPEKLITAKDKDGKEQDIPNPTYEAWVRAHPQQPDERRARLCRLHQDGARDVDFPG